MEKVVVTGGAGFIGSHIVDALVLAGYEVHIVDNLSYGSRDNVNPKAILHEVDIRNFEELNKIFDGVKYVFHQAAIPMVQFSIENPILTHEINVNGTVNVLEAARQSGVKRVIFASSSAIYGDPIALPMIETMNPNPLSPYGVHKLLGEVYCDLYSKIYNLETVCLRYFNVYGPRQSLTGSYPCVIALFIDLKKQNKPFTITGDGEQTRSFVNISDVVNANILAMKSKKVGKGESINIGTNEMYSINKITELIGGDKVYISPRIEPRATSADIIKAKNLLDWSPKMKIENGVSELKKYANIT